MKIALLAAAMVLPTASQQHATAVWLAESPAATAGKPIRTVIRMNVSEGWHTYWENPGEGGMPLAIEATLPDGWTMGGIQYPAPKRFMTGELAGFGYEGEVLLAVTVTPPAGFEGEIPALNATLSWLTCNDETCVPGESELSLPAKAEPEIVAKAYEALPKPIPGASLSLATNGDSPIITLTVLGSPDFDPIAYEVFPATRNIIAPSAKPVFSKHPSKPGTWIASAPKSEYLSGAPKELALILASPGKSAWKVSTEKP